MEKSEFNTIPRAIIMHDPSRNEGFGKLGSSELKKHNFLKTPDLQKIAAEFAAAKTSIEQSGIEVVDLLDLVGDDSKQLVTANPNSIFTRDPAVTLPWAPDVAIITNMTLKARQNEPEIMHQALQKMGIINFIKVPDEYKVEGGDVLPVVHDGKRTLIVGIGSRTQARTASFLAETLIPDYADQIIALTHDKQVLHLDTGFTILSDSLMFAARDAFSKCEVIDETGKTSYDPIRFAQELGFTIIRTTQTEAIQQERCNLLPLGNDHFISFTMPGSLKEQLQTSAGITIQEIEGKEIAKASGGIHCLTRPIF